MKNKHLRNLAMQLASQLPDDPDDLYFVLELMVELSDAWLYQERKAISGNMKDIKTERYLDRLRVRALGGSTLNASIEGESNVIKLTGKPEKSPR
jgi:hypothetical protein